MYHAPTDDDYERTGARTALTPPYLAYNAYPVRRRRRLLLLVKAPLTKVPSLF